MLEDAPRSVDCAELADLLAAVAANAAAGPDRARLLRHVVGCGDCRRELAELARVADDLLLLAPDEEPPAGFESAVLARMNPPRRRREILVAGVAALSGAAAAGAVWWTGAADRDRAATDKQVADRYRAALRAGDGKYLKAAQLRDQAGAVVGHVYAYQGNPSWVFVSVKAAPPGRYVVVVAAKDGRRWEVGRCEVTVGACGHGAIIQAGVHDLHAVRLETAQTALVARMDQ